jgi:hypothetical protein
VAVTIDNAQDVDELRIFRLFAEAAGLPLSLDTVHKREPPEPDIQCNLEGYGSTRFELVEIVDDGLARSVSNQVTFQDRLLEEAERRGLRGFSDGLIYVRFGDTAGSARRRQAIPAVVGLLAALPEGFEGDVGLGEELRNVVDRLRVSRGGFVGPCFHVDGTTVISDPIIERIDAKFSKLYESGDRVELLAYYELHPTRRADIRLPAVEAFVRESLPFSQFSRVWVFDAVRKSVLLAVG